MKYPSEGGKLLRPLSYLLLCASLIGSGSFATRAVSPGGLLINRVQITGGPGKTDNDFIELYNASSEQIDLNGLRLVKRTKTGTGDTTIKSWTSPILLDPGAVYLWANSSNGFAASLNADASSTQTLANDNGIAIREGAEDTGTIIDAVAWGSASNGLFEASPFPQNPGAGEILQRKEHRDRDNNVYDFELVSLSMNPICGNSAIEPPETCDDGNILENDGCSGACQLETPPIACGNGLLENGEQCDDHNADNNDGCSDMCQIEADGHPNDTTGNMIPIVYINEFIVDPVAGGNEWIELFSPMGTAISLKDWTLEDGSGTKTRINENDTVGGANRFFSIPKSTGALNNSGDIIILRDASGNIIDSVAYGDWDDGNVGDNAPTASDPYSIARIPDAAADGSDHENYAITSMLTMWSANIITPPITDEGTEDAEDNPDPGSLYDYAKTIALSEISPNPYGLDSLSRNGEFIELYNYGPLPVRLDGWRLEIGDKQYIYEFPADTAIAANSYLAVRASAGFQLDNNGTEIKLFQPLRSSAYQSVHYKETVEGQSWSLWHENEADSARKKIWKWTYLPTPGQANNFVSPPLAAFSAASKAELGQAVQFDSSDTDKAGTEVEYQWDFGDGNRSKSLFPEHAFNKAGSFTVVLSVKNAYGSSTVSRKIAITKPLVPAVEQSIALSKASETSVLNVNDKENSFRLQSPFNLALNEIMPNPEGSDSGREWIEIINNGKEAVNLAGWSIRNKNKIGIPLPESVPLEPGELFVFEAAFLPPSLGNSEDTISLLDPEGREASNVTYSLAPNGHAYIFLDSKWQWTMDPTPGEANNLETASVKNKKNPTAKKDAAQELLMGTVVALPGTFGAQYFYLQTDASPLLYQIYNSKKLFPSLKIGQRLSIKGEHSTTASGPRFKTRTAEDISLLPEEGSVIIADISSSLDIKNPPHPRVARVRGEITSKKSPRLIVTDEKGDTEIYLTKGSGLSITAFEIGDKVEVTGITQLDGTNVRLMPRSEEDINILNVPAGLEKTTNTNGIEKDFNNNPRSNKKSLFTYIIIAGLGIFATGAYFIWKYYGRKK